MHIVQNDGWILFQERTAVELLDQRAVCHEHHPGVVIDRRIEPHLVGDLMVITP